MGEIVTVNFRGDDLYGFKQSDGVYMAVKPMCDAMGLSWEPQRKRINRDPILSKATSIMEVPFGTAKGQAETCLLLKRVNFWLATIETSRITNEVIRDRVILYQEECADALYEYFTGRRPSDADGEPHDSMSLTEKMRLCDMVHRGFGMMAFRQLYFKVDLPRVPEMYRPEQNDLFHYGMIRQEAAE